VWIYTSNKLAKFHGYILSLSENTAKCFRVLIFLTHTVEVRGVARNLLRGGEQTKGLGDRKSPSVGSWGKAPRSRRQMWIRKTNYQYETVKSYIDDVHKETLHNINGVVTKN